MSNDAPRVCFVSDEVFPVTKGGIGRLLLESAQELAAQGWSITFLILASQKNTVNFQAYLDRTIPGCRAYRVDDVVTDEQRAEDIPLWAFHFLPYHQSYRVAKALRRLSAREAFDLVEFADYRGLGYVTLKERRLWGRSWHQRTTLADARVVVRLHGTFELWLKADGAQTHSRQELQTFAMERYCLEHADGWLCPSESVAAWYRDVYGAPAKPIAVSAPAFQQLGPGNMHPRSLGHSVEVLFYGKLQHLKGADVFVAAALKLCKAMPDRVRFHLVGHDVREILGPSYQKRLRSLIPRKWRSHFVFHGRILPERLPKIASRCTLAVVPSRVETFCLAAHELNWIGIPLVLRELPAFRDYFQDRVDCRFFEHDEHAAADSLASVLLDLLGQEAPFANWSWNAPKVLAAQRLPAAYREALTWPLAVDPADSLAREGVSVIIPYFNAHATIEATIDSVLRSTLSPEKVIIVDDGSSDPVAVSTFAALEERFAHAAGFVFVRKANGGLSSARNAGLAHSRSAFVLPLDADDLIEPDFLRLAVAALERCPELAAVSCFAAYFADGSPPEEVIDYVIAYDLDPLLITLENRAGVAGSVFRRTALPDVAYSPDLPAYEDWDLWWTLAERGAKAEVLPRILYRYRRRVSGLYASVGMARHHELLGRIEARHPALLERLGAARDSALARLNMEEGRLFRLRRRLRDLYHRLRS